MLSMFVTTIGSGVGLVEDDGTFEVDDFSEKLPRALSHA